MNTPVKIVAVSEMRRLEAEADAVGVSYAAMMEHAGKAVADAIVSRMDPKTANALILVGPGNNGGDGLVAARHLHDAGATVKVYCLKPPDESDSKVIELRQRSVFIVDAGDDMQSRVLKHTLGGANVIVDALFGTGARLPLRDKAAQVLGFVRRNLGDRKGGDHKGRPHVVAVDCPSGMDCDTGELDPNALRADLTITFGAAKVGQFTFPAADFIGDLTIADIGWPESLPGLQTIKLELTTAEYAKANLPPRPRDAHKYQFGRALILAGSKNYVGAAYLAGAAAARSGAGLVTLAVPESIHPILASQLVEATWLPLPDSAGAIAEGAVEVVRSALPKASALILGPGLGTNEATASFLNALVRSNGFSHPAAEAANTNSLRLLVDADGLRLMARIENWPALLPKPAVLTPHPGELSALIGLSTEAIQSDRLTIARKFAAQWGHVLLLKGAFTVIASPDSRAMIEPFATPALAKAGSGDVLSGLIGGLLAQGVPPFEAAATGAFIHGRAAEIAAESLGTSISLTARDILSAAPKAFATLSGV